MPATPAPAAPDLAEAHGAWAEVDLAAVAANVRAVRARLAPGVGLLAVLKADAYGHGAEAVAPVALAAGATALGVATALEGARLRAAGVAAPIWVLAGLPAAALDLAIAEALEPIVADPRQVDRLAARAEALGRVASVHVMVDVGLGRDGCAAGELAALVAAVEARPTLRLAGLGANLATFDGRPDGPLAGRLARFEAATAPLAAARPGLVRHAANSAAALGDAASHLAAVRVGDALYGAVDDPATARALGLAPAMAVRARLVQVRAVAAGTTVGYDDAWTAPRATRLGTLPVGFGDGLPAGLARGGQALVAGRPAPVVGRVGMSATVIDLGDAPAEEGDLVTLLGADGGAAVSLADWAALEGTDPYDLATRLGRALPRRFVGRA